MKVWKDSTPRLLAVDESGTAKMISDYNKRTEENRWIVISGVIFSQKSNLVNIKLILDLKNKYWKNGEFNGQRVVFHAREIKKGIGPFSEKNIIRENFINDLCETICNMDFQIVSVAIDKHNHFDQYTVFAKNPYSLAYQFLIERFCYTLKKGENSVILNESRGKKEDKKLYDLILPFLNSGGEYMIDQVHQINNIYFNKKLSDDKQKSYFMLEMADLASYTLHRYLRDDVSSDVFRAMQKKYKGGTLVRGKSYKVFPESCYKLIKKEG